LVTVLEAHPQGGGTVARYMGKTRSMDLLGSSERENCAFQGLRYGAK